MTLPWSKSGTKQVGLLTFGELYGAAMSAGVAGSPVGSDGPAGRMVPW